MGRMNNHTVRITIILVVILCSSPLNAAKPDFHTHRRIHEQLNQLDQNLDPFLFWRTNISQYQIVDIEVFPLLSFTSSSSIADLGKAWITWKINITNQILAMHAIYDRGHISQFTVGPQLFDDVTFFGVGSTLFVLSTNNRTTRVDLYNPDSYVFGGAFSSTRSKVMKVYIGTNSQFIYTEEGENNTHTIYQLFPNSPGAYFPETTQETVIAAGLNVAVFKHQNGSKTLYTSNGNYSLPLDMSDNIRIGHHLLNPAVYDLDNHKAWTPSYSFDLPDNVDNVFFYGLESSIIKTANNTYYEYGQGVWRKIGESLPEISTITILDIGLYISPVIFHGISYYAFGDDEDNDKVPDTLESYFGSQSISNDTDGDGFSDYQELVWGTNPRKNDVSGDIDQDLLTNGQELQMGTDPLLSDSDYGGALDGWEVKYGFNPLDPFDDHLDGDNDGVSNAIESQANSNPNLKDTDGDKIPDKWEIQFSLNPNDASDATLDPDGDSWTNYQEYLRGTDPFIKNSRPLFDGLWLWLLIITLLLFYPALITYRKIFSEEKIQSQ